MARWYANAPVKALNAEVDLDDGMFWQLHTSTYTPNLVTDAYQSTLTGELTTSGGYTVGGLAAGASTRVVTAANSWTVQRANSTAYAVDDVVRPATGNGFLYRCAVAGTSGASIPTYPVVLGTTVADGGVTWEMVGSSITVISFADPVWPTFTATGIRYAVLIDKTTGSAATSPLICLIDFGTNQAGGGGNFTIVQHAALRTLHILTP